ncbi:hypothetical protein JXR93_01250 [bacterium]|nr:hypothetical protein [bacterium]
MFFTNEEFKQIKEILNDCNHRVWYEHLPLFSHESQFIYQSLQKWLPIDVISIDDLERIIENWIKKWGQNRRKLFAFTCSSVKYVLDCEDFFATDLEMLYPQVRIMYMLMDSYKLEVFEEPKYISLKKEIENSLEKEILEKGNPSTITALNVILNASSENFSEGAYHTFKEIINAWCEYFVLSYTQADDFGKELLIDVMRIDFIEKIFKFIE